MICPHELLHRGPGVIIDDDVKRAIPRQDGPPAAGRRPAHHRRRLCRGPGGRARPVDTELVLRKTIAMLAQVVTVDELAAARARAL